MLLQAKLHSIQENTGSMKMVSEYVLVIEPVSLAIQCVFMQKCGEPLGQVDISQ